MHGVLVWIVRVVRSLGRDAFEFPTLVDNVDWCATRCRKHSRADIAWLMLLERRFDLMDLR